nr:uncharacterized protein LOC104846770 [Loxodonta africana]XP_023414956.1 uncharacterized protein LOC104846770 [Loxodonta africana]
MPLPGIMSFFTLALLIPIIHLTNSHQNYLVQLSQAMAIGENLSDCWICHATPDSGTPRLYRFIPLTNVSLLTPAQKGTHGTKLAVIKVLWHPARPRIITIYSKTTGGDCGPQKETINPDWNQTCYGCSPRTVISYKTFTSTTFQNCTTGNFTRNSTITEIKLFDFTNQPVCFQPFANHTVALPELQPFRILVWEKDIGPTGTKGGFPTYGGKTPCVTAWRQTKWTKICHPAGTFTYNCNETQAFAYQFFNGTRGVKTCTNREVWMVDHYIKYMWADNIDGTHNGEKSLEEARNWTTASWGPLGGGQNVAPCIDSPDLQTWMEQANSILVCTPTGVWFACRDRTGNTWALNCIDRSAVKGRCSLGWVIPPEGTIKIYQGLITTPPDALMPEKRKRRLGLAALGITALVTALGGLAGVAYNAHTIQNASSLIEQNAEDAGQGLTALHTALDSLANQVLDHRLALDYLLAKRGGVCAIANTSCCLYINPSRKVEVRIQKLLNRAKWLGDAQKKPGR